jgi:NAD(P)-dependent dehydrogenase (short-subunit alcohol dehydrogenase family)
MLGPPTCLVNNASEFLVDTVATVTAENWDTHLDINLKAPVFLARALYLHLPEGESGNVINIIDQRVWRLTPDFFSYTISKAGLWTATRTLAQALAPRVRVNAIGPGPVLKSIHQTENDFAAEVRSTLLKRGPSPAEIAAAVRFILDAPAMTGQMIALDGGQHLTWGEGEQP